MSAVEYRLMTVTDLDSVLALEFDLFGEEAWSKQMLVGELGQQPASRYYLVAEQGGEIIAYAGLMAAGGQGDVLTVAVATARWGQGIGSALLDQLIAEAGRRGCTEVFLEVRADNARAHRLYRWFGFTDIGIRPAYYQPSGTDAIVMRLDLPQPASSGSALS
jgi:ribosomal-protein-alanine N-acetyltransferase